jgi:endogenous inhibitor of DNA gyrase (YacG/DUF329 family)
MVTEFTCSCGHRLRTGGEGASHQDQCPKCGKPVPPQKGYRTRMYLFQRAYVDYVGYLLTFRNQLGGIPRKVWGWFWKATVARVIDGVVFVCMIVAGIGVGVAYVAYEARHGRALGPSTVIGSGLVTLYVGMIALSWRRPVHILARLSSAIAAAGSILLLTTVAIVIAAAGFAAYLAVLLLLTAASMLVFLPMRLRHYIYLLRRRISYSCPYDDCPTKGRRLPIHICECGAEYSDLRPGFYGIFYHKCKHGDDYHKLPTLDILGRNKLARKCSGCGRPLRHSSLGDARPLSLVVVGAPGAGKTVLITQAVRSLCAAIAKIPGAKVRIDSQEQKTTLMRDCDFLDKGVPLAKTTGIVMEAVGVAIKTPRQERFLVQIFDAPGEHYQEFGQFGRKEVMRRADGVMLLLDACPQSRLSVPDVDMEETNGPVDSSHQAVVSNLVQLAKMAGIGENGRKDVRVAVVLTKIDTLPSATVAHLLGSPGDSATIRRSSNLLHKRCHDVLLRLGYGNELRGLETAFPNLRYFACTALGRDLGSDAAKPVKAVGVVRPFSFVLNLPAIFRRDK